MTFCSAFWNHTNIRSDNRIFPCCRFKTPIAEFDGNVGNILFHPTYDDLRKKSSNNEYIQDCSKCYYEESLGKKSLRNKFNEMYDGSQIQLKDLEIGFDNICNLTCDGCFVEFSSAWGHKLNSLKPKKYFIKSTKDFYNLPNNLSKVTFLGGEPLMTNRHKNFLSKLENKKEISVTYNTNGTFLLEKDLITLLHNFKKVEFVVSIDAYGIRNNVVREGSKWEDIVTFLDQLANCDFNFSIHTVLHKNNILDIFELEAWILKNNYKWTTNILTYPEHLDIKNCTQEVKNSFLLQLDNSFVPNKNYIKEHLNVSN